MYKYMFLYFGVYVLYMKYVLYMLPLNSVVSVILIVGWRRKGSITLTIVYIDINSLVLCDTIRSINTKYTINRHHII